MKKIRKSRHARLAATVIAVGVFASLASVGYAAGLVPFVHTSPTAAQYPTSKVTICHHTHSQKNPFVTITVSQNALKAHLGNHGDTVGPCPTNGTTGAQGHPVAPVVIAKAPHTKSNNGHKGHGKSSVHGSHAVVKVHGRAALGLPTDVRRGDIHGRKNGHSSTHSQGKGHANNGKSHGHDKTQTHGHGQGHGQGHGPGGTHGNSGGNGKGNKH